MSLQRKQLNEAVDALLVPRHYEFLLYLQRELDRDGHILPLRRYDCGRAVMRIIQADKKSRASLKSIDDALLVLKEALRRLE